MVEYKHNLISTVMSSLQSDTVACRNRTDLSNEAHSTLLSQRQAVMQDLKVWWGLGGVTTSMHNALSHRGAIYCSEKKQKKI